MSSSHFSSEMKTIFLNLSVKLCLDAGWYIINSINIQSLIIRKVLDVSIVEHRLFLTQLVGHRV
jgi:hypothetical protein